MKKQPKRKTKRSSERDSIYSLDTWKFGWEDIENHRIIIEKSLRDRIKYALEVIRGKR